MFVRKIKNFFNKRVVQGVIAFFLFTLINSFYFLDFFSVDGIISFNDFNIPQDKNLLDDYLRNFSIYNINANLGLIRLNFFNEIPPLVFLDFISIFFDYSLSSKLFYVLGFTLINISFYLIFQKISKNWLISFLSAIVVVYNLWFYDRLQQGHFWNLLFFYPLLGLFIYKLFYTEYPKKYLHLAFITFFSFLVSYHYSIIIIYIYIIDFFSNIILKKGEIFKVLKNYLYFGLIFFVLMFPLFLPYLLNLDKAQSTLSNVSNLDSLSLFSWQSTSLSSFFYLRTGMYSFRLLSDSIFYFYLFGVLMLIALILFFCRRSELNLRILVVLLILYFFSFSYRVNEGVSLFLYDHIPLFKVFRDMNKFTGVIYLLNLFLIINCLKQRLSKKIIAYYSVAILLFILPFLSPYKLFLVSQDDSLYVPSREYIYSVAQFPSYPMTFIRNDNVNYHKYINTISSVNGFRSVYLPFEYSMGFSDIEKYDYYNNLYDNWDWLSEEQIYQLFSKYGVQYIYYYKDYPIILSSKTKDKPIKIDVAGKFSKHFIVFESSDLIVYKVPDIYFSPFFIKDSNFGELLFKRESDSEYKILSAIEKDKKVMISMKSNYDKNWELYLIPFNQDWCVKNKEYEDGVLECVHANIFFDWVNLLYFYSSSSFSQFHLVADGYANSWMLDSNFIKNSFSKEYYQEDESGNLKVNLLLLYKPQVIFIFGLLLSGLILSLLLFFLRR